MQRLVNRYNIEELIAGDEAVFKLFYDEYSSKVYRIAFRFLKDKTQSEDIVQQTFINFWLNRDKLDKEGDIWLYLYVIAKRLSLNLLRHIYRSADLRERLLTNITNIHNSTEEDILVNDLERFAEKVINMLPQQQKLVFKLSRTNGLSHKEIANKLNISPNTVKNHMVEALKALRERLKYSDFTYLYILLFFNLI